MQLWYLLTGDQGSPCPEREMVSYVNSANGHVITLQNFLQRVLHSALTDRGTHSSAIHRTCLRRWERETDKDTSPLPTISYKERRDNCKTHPQTSRWLNRFLLRSTTRRSTTKWWAQVECTGVGTALHHPSIVTPPPCTLAAPRKDWGTGPLFSCSLALLVSEKACPLGNWNNSNRNWR